MKMIEEIGMCNSSEELDSVLNTLEIEYSNLNRHYQDILERKNKQSSEPSSVMLDTDELRQVLDDMDKKAKQLSFLRKHRETVKKQIKLATSPPRIRGAKKRVKA
jgi:DNA-directed RNA polymerase subunit H (RpoH/RPB5)